MPPAINFSLVLRLLTTVVTIAVAVRLYRLGLHRRYVIFFSYLIFRGVRTLVMLPLGVRSVPYLYLWTITEPLLWLFYILLVLEIYRLVLEDYKGIYSVGRWALYVCLTLAVIASGSTLLPGWNTGNAKSPMVLFYLVIERGVIFSMVLFILLLGLFLSSYPIRISRNIIVHTALYTVYFLSSTLMLLVQALTGFHVSKAFNTGLVLTGILCGFGWLILLKKEEQASRVVLRYEWKPEDEERLVQQLTAINSSLLRTVRK